MTGMEDQDLRSLFAQGEEPDNDARFVSGVMSRIAQQRRSARWSRRLAVAGLLLAAALLAPWMGHWVGEGFRLLAQTLAPTPELTLASLGVFGLVGVGLATWAFRN